MTSGWRSRPTNRATLLARNTLGRWLIRREAAAFQAVAGIACGAGFPGPDRTVCHRHSLGRRGAVEGAHRRSSGRRDLRPVWRSSSTEFHERGVALADLHHRDVLLAEDGFALCARSRHGVGRRGPAGSVSRYLFERFCESDRVNLARMRARFTGGDPEAAVASVSPAAAAWHRRGRKVKSILNRLRGKRAS